MTSAGNIAGRKARKISHPIRGCSVYSHRKLSRLLTAHLPVLPQQATVIQRSVGQARICGIVHKAFGVELMR